LSPVPGIIAAGSLRLRLHGGLRFFSSEAERLLAFSGSPSLKHLLEGAGIPHPEVDWLRIDGFPAPLDISAREGMVVDAGTSVRAQAGGEPWRFVLDCHLGRLAKHLRLMGFDTLYSTHTPDGWLAAVSAGEQRWLLTRDKALLFRSIIERGCLIRTPQPRAQLAQVLDRHDCMGSAAPMSRCLVCNTALQPAPLEEALSEAPPKTRVWCREFYRCPGCLRLYWKGSHYDRLLGLVKTHLRR
jgi:uncharacterized protein with PIN domain